MSRTKDATKRATAGPAEKKARLIRVLAPLESLLVAFSGGVDSTFLIAVAREALGKKAVAVTARSPIHPEREIADAVEIARALDVTHYIVESKEMDLPAFRENPQERCYFCKKAFFEELRSLSARLGVFHIAHGANMDDLSDYRPGARAAEEMGILAPLVEAGLTKAEIRILSAEIGLKTWNKPALACLATRIPCGTPITEASIEMVALAESHLHGLGFDQCRVRHHGTVAKIEIDPSRFGAILEEKIRRDIAAKLKSIGFSHVSLDLEGYAQGMMNRSLAAGARGRNV
jgi:pyridinium-3,5-biscarboxylic acid mononucleotide sulfurtransferase